MRSCGGGSGDVSLESFQVILLLEFIASSHGIVSFVCTFSLTRGTDGVWDLISVNPSLMLTLLLLLTGIAVLSKDEVEGNVPKKSVQSILTHLYPKDYTRPTMKEALTEADLTEKQVKIIFNVCESFQTKGGCLKDLLRTPPLWPCTPTTLGPRTLRATRTGSSTGTLLKCRGRAGCCSL